MYQNAAQTYRSQSVMTTSPAQRVAMVMDICITALRDAAAAADAGEIERRANAVRKAREIVMYMEASLDPDHGGEIARDLAQIYSYAQRRMGQVDMKNDAAAAREVADLLEPLRQAWVDLAKEAHAAPAPASYGQRADAARGDLESLNLST